MGDMEKNIQPLKQKTSLYCSNIIYLAVILTPFAASFSSAVVEIFTVLMIVAFLVKRVILKNLSFTKTPILWFFLLIMFFSLISFFKTVSLRASLQGMRKLIHYGAVFIIITEELKDVKHAKRVIVAALLGLLLASLDSIWQLYSGWDFFRHYPYRIQGGLGFPRIRAAFPHTNIFAAYLGLFLPLAFSMVIYHWNKRFRRTFHLIVFILALFCLFWTFSQGAIAGFVLALILIGIKRKNKFIFIFLICIIVVTPLILPSGIKSLIKESDSVWDFLLNPQRIGDFRNALNMIRHNPILGVGVNTYVLNIDKYMIDDGSKFVGHAGYSHNIYLHMTAEIGIFGLISFLWLIFVLFRYALDRYRKIKDSFLKISVLGITAGLLGFLINGLTETVLYYPKVVILFWFWVGLLLGIIKVSEQGLKINPS